MARRPPEKSFTEDLTGAVLHEVLEHPRVQGLLDKLSGLVDRGAKAIDDVARNGGNGRAPQGHVPPTKPTRPKFDPRIIMGFVEGEKLTKDGVNARYKALARVYHTDLHGGSDEAMKRLNVARDALLKRLK